MKAASWKEIAELVGMAAIVASLVFVGLEMRQTRKLAMAAAYQARTDSELAITFATLQSGINTEIISKIVAGTELTDEEYRTFRLLLEARLSYWENAHYQWENDLLTDEFWNANVDSMKAFVLNQHAHRYWQGSRHLWRETFRSTVDQVLDDWGEGTSDD